MKHLIPPAAILILSATLTACGGSGSSSSNDGDTPTPPDTPQTAQGVFLDSAVEGLGYTSGALSGFTDNTGAFEYEDGQSVTFTIGDIVIGTANGADTLTPLELIATASDASDPAVINIARFLQTLDDDGNPDNGILILPSVRDLAIDQTINFDQSVDAFTDDGNVQTVVSTLTTVTSAGARMLIDAATASAHLNATLNALNDDGGNDGGNDGGGDNPPTGNSQITLSGEDTADIGTVLTIGDAAYDRPDLTGVAEAVVVVDENSTIGDDLFSSIGDFNNNFILVIGTNGLSMTVVRGGVSYSYACEVTGQVFIACGDLVFDLPSQTATLTDVTVENTDTDSVLTLNGSVQWQ